MSCIILVEHCICDIRHVSSSITLTSDVDFIVAYAKDILALKSQRESRKRVSPGTELGNFGRIQ
jgi:hypothetical protein